MLFDNKHLLNVILVIVNLFLNFGTIRLHFEQDVWCLSLKRDIQRKTTKQL